MAVDHQALDVGAPHALVKAEKEDVVDDPLQAVQPAHAEVEDETQVESDALPHRALSVSTDMSDLPLTPQARKVALEQLTTPPGSARSTQSAPTPRHGRRIRYIRSREVPPPPVPRTASAGHSGAQRDHVDRIITLCHDVSAGRIKRMAPVHTEAMHAIAAKERVCMELREELAREESQLEELRSAWRRMTMRIGTNSPAPRNAPHAQEKAHTRPRTRTSMQPVAAPAASPAPATAAATATPNGSLSTPPRTNKTLFPPRPSDASSHSAKVAETSRTDLRSIPSQLSHQFQAVMEQIQFPDDDSGPPLTSSPSHDRVQRRSSRYMAPLAQAQEMLKEDLNTDVLREKLSSGWQTLSQRLRETTASFADMSTWMSDDAQPVTSQSSRASLPFSMDDGPFGRLSGLDSVHAAVPVPSKDTHTEASLSGDMDSPPPLPPKTDVAATAAAAAAAAEATSPSTSHVSTA